MIFLESFNVADIRNLLLVSSWACNLVLITEVFLGSMYLRAYIRLSHNNCFLAILILNKWIFSSVACHICQSIRLAESFPMRTTSPSVNPSSYRIRRRTKKNFSGLSTRSKYLWVVKKSNTKKISSSQCSTGCINPGVQNKRTDYPRKRRSGKLFPFSEQRKTLNKNRR